MDNVKPLPLINGDNEQFWKGCARHELRFQKCRRCGFVRWPPSFLCPECHYTDAEMIRASGRGRVYSFVVYHMAYHQGFTDDLPYVVALVELAEGPRFLSNIVGCEPDDVACDMPVEVVWDDIGEWSLPKFRLLP
ncbi:MAG: Zn-ribbon domain-containing OB-fold protein [Deltaproteobacteria bacterium]|nr:Zn-ribbon domain-containing OB-fold protein [Deltaproteobacteria bacterium]